MTMRMWVESAVGGMLGAGILMAIQWVWPRLMDAVMAVADADEEAMHEMQWWDLQRSERPELSARIMGAGTLKQIGDTCIFCSRPLQQTKQGLACTHPGCTGAELWAEHHGSNLS